MHTRRASIGVLAICAGYFMVILDTTALNSALPVLRSDLGTGIDALQWVVDGYALTFAAALLTGGTLGDRFGARGVFQLGSLGFDASSVACGIAPRTATLVGARLVPGSPP
jgi:DHA2 family methylenomycin A resistance protein-like MFS transporter